MVTITTELGTFEASTEKEAKVMLRKAMAAVKKAEQERSANADRAHELAQVNGYRILCRIAEEQTMPHGWFLHELGDNYSPCKVTIRAALCGGAPIPECVWEGADGKAESSHYGHDFLGCVSNGAGYPMACFLRCQHTYRVDAYAVGIFADQIAFVALPGISIAQFQKREEEAA